MKIEIPQYNVENLRKDVLKQMTPWNDSNPAIVRFKREDPVYYCGRKYAFVSTARIHHKGKFYIGYLMWSDETEWYNVIDIENVRPIGN